MKKLPIFALSLALGLGSSTFLLANDTPDPADAPKPAAKASKTRGLVAPYSKMSTLTADQKDKIIAIHKALKDDEKKLEDKADADIMAILGDEQKAELDKIQDDAKASRKKTPATKPAM